MAALPGAPPARGAAFFLRWEFHRPILAPVHEALQDRAPCLLSASVEEIVAFRPAVLVMADDSYRRFAGRLPETLVVFTRHGFASKHVWERAFTGCDFACVSSPWVRRDLLARGLRPRMGFWITGFLPMDQVFRAAGRTPPPGLPLDLSAGRRNLLYAPTHNPGLHSFPVIGAEWISEVLAAAPELNIIIKPHPVTADRNPDWMSAWRRAAAGDPRVLLVEDAHSDVYRFFPITDVLLTDVSSVAFYFLAMDRPIIMVDPAQPEAAGRDYDPDGPEWRWRDMALTVARAGELVPAIQRALADPGEKSERRAAYREMVFGNLTDGGACRRLADRLAELLQPEEQRPEWAEIAWACLRSRGESAGAPGAGKNWLRTLQRWLRRERP